MPGFDDAFNDVFASYLEDNPSVNIGNDDSPFMGAPSKEYFGNKLNADYNSGGDAMSKYWKSFGDKGLTYAGQGTTIQGMPGNSEEGANLTPNQVFERGAGKQGNFVSAPKDYGRNLGYFWGANDGSALSPEGAGASWTPTDNYGNGLDALAKTAYNFTQTPGFKLGAAAFGVGNGMDYFGGADLPYDAGENLLNNPEVFGGGDASWGVNPNFGNAPMSTMGGQYADPNTLQMGGGAPMSTTSNLTPSVPGAGSPNIPFPSLDIDPSTGKPTQQPSEQKPAGAPQSTMGGQFVDPTTLQMSGGAPMSSVADFSAPSFDGGGADIGFGDSGMPLGTDSNIVDPEDPDKLLKQQSQGAPTTTPAGAPPAAAPKGAAAGPGAGADKSFIQKAVDSVTKNPLQAASLAANAYKQYQTSKDGKSAQDQLKQLSQPARDASNQLISEGMAGNVPAPIMQQFQTTLQNTISSINSRYANMGRDPNNDSSAQAEIKQAKDQMDAQVANYASTLLNQGLSAAGVANGPATAAINAGVAQDKELSTAMSQSLQQMAMLQAMQQGKQP